MTSSSPEARIGGVVGGRYRLESVLGRGGMGVLFVAEHMFTRRKVALKLLSPDREDLPELRARFLTEARTAAAVPHPNVVDVLDMGVDEEGAPFLAMELLEGSSLDRALSDRGRLSPEQALAWMLPIAGALAALHDAGIVHRDIKPSNIFLARGVRGGVEPKLLDFGLARTVSDLRLTRSGLVIGTPLYMAPEHAAGEEVGLQADVWSLGVVLYECLTGEPPYQSRDSAAIAAQVLAGQTRPMHVVRPEIPKPLADAVERALRRDLARRYRNMRELAQSLLSAAVTAHIAVPDDPDPVGLPDFRRWRADPHLLSSTKDSGPMQPAAGGSRAGEASGPTTELPDSAPSTTPASSSELRTTSRSQAASSTLAYPLAVSFAVLALVVGWFWWVAHESPSQAPARREPQAEATPHVVPAVTPVAPAPSEAKPVEPVAPAVVEPVAPAVPTDGAESNALPARHVAAPTSTKPKTRSAKRTASAAPKNAPAPTAPSLAPTPTVVPTPPEPAKAPAATGVHPKWE